MRFSRLRLLRHSTPVDSIVRLLHDAELSGRLGASASSSVSNACKREVGAAPRSQIFSEQTLPRASLTSSLLMGLLPIA